MSEGAEQAFEQLRAEVTVMRRAIEELQRAVEAIPTIDYGETLGEIGARHDEIAEDIGTIAAFTGAMSHGERLQRELTWARDTALRPALDALARTEQQAASTARLMQDMLRARLAFRARWRAVGLTAAIGIALGLMLYPVTIGWLLGSSAEVSSSKGQAR